MPQKPLLRIGKKIEKKQAANRHGKVPTQRKGKYEKPPKKGIELERYKENKELSKVINTTNESNFAVIAQGKGGKLKTLKGPPPALAPKDKAAKAKQAKLAAKAAKTGHTHDSDIDEDMEEDDE